MKRFIVIVATLLFMAVSLSAREVRSLNEGWAFRKSFVRVGPVAGASFGRGPVGDPVTLPHTWNAEDDMSGSYYRGFGTYTRTLTVSDAEAGKRFFLKFDGAGTMATVQVNSRYVGEHKGAYTAFCFTALATSSSSV